MTKGRDNMAKSIVLLSVVSVAVLAAYNLFFVFPSFTNLLTEVFEDDSVRIATHLKEELFPEDVQVEKGALSAEFRKEAELLKKDFGLLKIVVLSHSGETLYSSDAADIGHVIKKKFFGEVVAKGMIHKEFVRKNTPSASGQTLSADVVETYVPIMRGGKFFGACEVYVDITRAKAKNDRLFLKSFSTLFVLVLGLLGAVVIMSIWANRGIAVQRKAEERLKLFSQAIEEAMDGVQITDLNGYIMYSNKAVEEIYGFSSKEFLGRHVGELNADKEFAGRVILPAIQKTGRWDGEVMVLHRDGRAFPIWLSASIVRNDKGERLAMVGIIRDITLRKLAEQDRENLILKLNDAVANIKTLKGLLPICAWCKKIRDDKGYWKRVETYIKERSDASFTHCICPECLKKESPETYDEILKDRSELLGGFHPEG
jgi:PAS domain S-box-containing protein